MSIFLLEYNENRLGHVKAFKQSIKVPCISYEVLVKVTFNVLSDYHLSIFYMYVQGIELKMQEFPSTSTST